MLAKLGVVVCEKTWGSEHPNTMVMLNILAAFYRIRGDYTKAEPLLLRALAITEKALEPEHPDTILSLSNLAILYRLTGAYAKAEPLLQRALVIAEKALGPEHPETARSLGNLGVLYQCTGAYTKAEPLLERALAIVEKALDSEHPDTARARNNLAVLYQCTGAYTKAEPLLERALAIVEKALGSEHPDTARARNNLAVVYQAMGIYAKAEPLLERALVIYEKAFGLEHPDVATVLNNLAELYRLIGAYAKAEPLYERAVAIIEKSLRPEHRNVAMAHNNLALLYLTTGAYTKAELLLEQALAFIDKTLGPEHPDTAVAVNNLAKLYGAKGAFTKAEPLFERALAITEKALGPEHPNVALALIALAELYDATGAYAKAEPLHERGLAIAEKALGPGHPATAHSIDSLAVHYRLMGAYDKAEPLHERALAIIEKALGPEHPDTARTLKSLARLYNATGAYIKAEPLYERGQSIQEVNTVRFLFSGSEARKHAYLHQRERSVFENVSLSLVNPTERSTALGLTSVLQYKGRVLDAMSDSKAQLRRAGSKQDRALLDELATVTQDLSTLTFRGLGKLSPQAYRERLDLLARDEERLQTELSSRSAVLRQAIMAITLQSVRAALPCGATLVEYFCYRPRDATAVSDRWGVPRYVAYVLKRAGEPAAIDLGVAQSIDDLVLEFRTALSDPASTSFTEAAAKLFEKLIKPLLSHCAESTRLLLSPDGALNLMPFAVLADENGKYLLEHFEITYLTSGRDLLRLVAQSPPESSAVVVADPNYGEGLSGGPTVETSSRPTRSADLDRSGLIFTPLPGTADEARALQSLLKIPARQLLTGDSATEARLRELHGPRVLHLATHGFFLNDLQMKATLRHSGFGGEMAPLALGENPLLRSGLALAGANARRSGEADDGILTAAEAAELDLFGTQLVVLSACETGIGTVQTGEGVYGLRRALVLAGARTQLVSLWKVNDDAARELMVDYYQRLMKGEGRSGALRAAQQAMMANPSWQHPCYWAAFIPIGDWSPLPKAYMDQDFTFLPIRLTGKSYSGAPVSQPHREWVHPLKAPTE
ncbi:MAG: CHAT domain-containing protein [Nitrospira sp.]|nr:CHAT domain-containing protein [Nitrospira sp.]